MAAPTKYATPLDQLMELAAAAIHPRGAGGQPRVPFEEFWQRAVRPGQTIVMTTTKSAPEDCIRWPTDRNDRITWQGAIEDAREGIRRAYERRSATRHELGLAFLAPSFERLRETEAEEEFDDLVELMAA